MTPHHVPRSGEMKPCPCILSGSLLPGYSVTDWKGVRRGCINDHVQLVNPRWERSSRRENDSDLIAQWNTNHSSFVVATWQLRCLCVTLPGCLLKSVRWVCGDNDNVKSLAIRFVLPAACEVKSLCFLRTSVVRRWHSDSLTLLFIQELDELILLVSMSKCGNSNMQYNFSKCCQKWLKSWRYSSFFWHNTNGLFYSRYYGVSHNTGISHQCIM